MPRTTHRVPAIPPPSRKISRAFRKQMLLKAGMIFAALAAVLLTLAGKLDGKTFFIAALLLIPVAALTFNFTMRRAYAAQQQRLKR